MIEIITADITKLNVDAILSMPPTVRFWAAVAWMARSTGLPDGNCWKPAVNSTVAKPAKPASRPDSNCPQNSSSTLPARSGTAASAMKPNS